MTRVPARASRNRRHALNFALGQASEPVRAGHDPQRRVTRVYWVKVHAHFHHALKSFERRLDLDKPGLNRPWPETGGVDPLTDNDCAVLMPAKRPVPPSRFVEQDRTNRESPGSDCGRSYRTDWSGNLKQRLKQRPLPDPHSGRVDWKRCQGSLEANKRRFVQRFREEFCSVPVGLRSEG